MRKISREAIFKPSPLCRRSATYMMSHMYALNSVFRVARSRGSNRNTNGTYILARYLARRISQIMYATGHRYCSWCNRGPKNSHRCSFCNIVVIVQILAYLSPISCQRTVYNCILGSFHHLHLGIPSLLHFTTIPQPRSHIRSRPFDHG